MQIVLHGAIHTNGDNMQETIVITVCTRGRPQMLDDCLLSLMRQRVPEGVRAALIVVDNEPRPNNRAGVERRAAAFPFPVHYVHEPQAGLANARNAAVASALTLGADWLAFIDDDETAEADWLMSLYGAAFKHGRRCNLCGKTEPVDVVAGRVEYDYPPDAAKWRRRGQWGNPTKVDGTELGSAATNNTLVRAALVRETGARFDAALNFAGGEDTAFFHSLRARGARIVWSAKAIVRETVPWARLTWKGQMRLAYHVSLTLARDSLAFDPGFRASRAARKALQRACGGLIKLVLSPAALILGPGKAMHALMSGSRNLAQAAGVAAALAGVRSNYYREVTGH